MRVYVVLYGGITAWCHYMQRPTCSLILASAFLRQSQIIAAIMAPRCIYNGTICPLPGVLADDVPAEIMTGAYAHDL
jgi:hypothetical protein